MSQAFLSESPYLLFCVEMCFSKEMKERTKKNINYNNAITLIYIRRGCNKTKPTGHLDVQT